MHGLNFDFLLLLETQAPVVFAVGVLNCIPSHFPFFFAIRVSEMSYDPSLGEESEKKLEEKKEKLLVLPSRKINGVACAE